MVRHALETLDEWLNGQVMTKRKHLLLIILVGFGCFGFITWQVRSLQEADRQDDLRDAAIATYEVELRTYDNSLHSYENCLSQVEILGKIKEGFIRSAESKRGLVDVIAERTGMTPSIVALYAVVDAEIAEIERDLLVPDAEIDCPPEPVPPIPPVDYTERAARQDMGQ